MPYYSLRISVLALTACPYSSSFMPKNCLTPVLRIDCSFIWTCRIAGIYTFGLDSEVIDGCFLDFEKLRNWSIEVDGLVEDRRRSFWWKGRSVGLPRSSMNCFFFIIERKRTERRLLWRFYSNSSRIPSSVAVSGILSLNLRVSQGC